MSKRITLDLNVVLKWAKRTPLDELRAIISMLNGIEDSRFVATESKKPKIELEEVPCGQDTHTDPI